MTSPAWEAKARSAVATGAAWFDLVRPGWARVIELGTFSMAHGRRCALGQLVLATHPHSMGYLEVVAAQPVMPAPDLSLLRLFGLEERLPLEDAVRRGFTVRGEGGPMWVLQSEWERQVRERWAA